MTGPGGYNANGTFVGKNVPSGGGGFVVSTPKAKP